jgi:uncharacterized membrane protein
MEALLTLLALCVIIVPIIIIAVLFSRISRLERELRHLSASIPAVIRSILKEGPGAAVAEPARAAAEKTPPAAARPETVSAPLPSPLPPPTPQPQAAPPRQEPPRPSAPPPPSRTKEEWEALIGGKLLNRIGALALIIGVGFFLKYAFDRDWINAATRVLIGGATGGALLLGAVRTYRRGLAIFAQGLVGAGIAILYLSVYASFNFYHLVPQVAAFGLMTGVTALAFVFAFKYDSLAIAMMAWLGGFLTPFLLSTGEANEMGLFTYIALLDAGILIISLKKTAWTVLEPLALAGTWLVYLLWYSSQYTVEAISLTLYFVLLYWILFHILSTGRALRGESTFVVLRLISAVAGGVFAYVALYALLEPDFHAWAGGATLLGGFLYAGTAFVLRAKNPSAERWIALDGTGAAILIVTATAIQFTGFTTVSFWAVEALALAWLGARYERTHFSILSFALFVTAGFKLLVTEGALVAPTTEHVVVFFNQRGLTYAILAVSAWVSSATFGHVRGPAGGLLRGTVSAGASVLVFILLTVETAAYFSRIIRVSPLTSTASLEFHRWLCLAVVWSVYGTASAWIGMGRDEKPAYAAGLVSLLAGFAAAALAGFAFEPVVDFTLVFNWRFGALLAIALLGLALARKLQGDSAAIPWRKEIFPLLRMGVVLLLLLLATGETRDFFGKDIALERANGRAGANSAEMIRLENLQQLSLSGVWLVFSIALMTIGILRRSRALRVTSIVLFGATILKIFIYDLSFLDTLYRIFSFIGLGVILLGVSYAYQRYKDLIFSAEPPGGDPPSGS